jgi:hypothetical protein
MAQQPESNAASSGSNSSNASVGQFLDANLGLLYRSVESMRVATDATNSLARQNAEALDRLLQLGIEARNVATANAERLTRTEALLDRMRLVVRGSNREFLITPPTLSTSAETGAWRDDDEGDKDERCASRSMVDFVVNSHHLKRQCE